MNTFQHEKCCAAVKQIFDNEFSLRWMGDFRRRQNDAINDLQLCWKSLNTNFKKLSPTGGKMFDCF